MLPIYYLNGILGENKQFKQRIHIFITKQIRYYLISHIVTFFC